MINSWRSDAPPSACGSCHPCSPETLWGGRVVCYHLWASCAPFHNASYSACGAGSPCTHGEGHGIYGETMRMAHIHILLHSQPAFSPAFPNPLFPNLSLSVNQSLHYFLLIFECKNFYKTIDLWHVCFNPS